MKLASINRFLRLLDPLRIQALKYDYSLHARLWKVLYWMRRIEAEKGERTLLELLEEALAPYPTQEARRLILQRLKQNRKLVDRFGLFDADTAASMRRGCAPMYQKGIHKGEKASWDHVLPRQRAPELARCLFNFSILPVRENSRKRAFLGSRAYRVGKLMVSGGFLSRARYTRLFPNHPLPVAPVLSRHARATPATASGGALDVDLLHLGLIDYVRALDRQQTRFRPTVQHISQLFAQLFRAYDGRRAEELKLDWQHTERWFTEWLRTTRQLSEFLENRAAQLDHL